MAQRELTSDDAWTPNQVVAWNLRRARMEKGWSQGEAAKHLARVSGGVAWSTAVWSAAERSVDGGRVRQFDADLLALLALTFQRPVVWFLSPPSGATVRIAKEVQTSAAQLQRLIVDTDRSGLRETASGERRDTRAENISERLDEWSLMLRDLLGQVDAARSGDAVESDTAIPIDDVPHV